MTSDTICGLATSCFDYFKASNTLTFIEADHKKFFYQNIMLSAGYNSINLATPWNYFRGGMFFIDQSFDGRIALEKTNSPTCLSDYVTDLNGTLVRNMNLIYPITSLCQLFYFRAFGKKYSTIETI